ncbi:MAG: DUF167 domain-containing protein [Betaproteobacteria bacterium]|nr:DUF167 domain-containing protein [Betaproteobacteria bacterium]
MIATETGSNWLRPLSDGVEIILHIQPGACRTEIVGPRGDALKVRVAARAVDGAANEALLDFLAQCLGLRRRAVRILRGELSRHKAIWAAIGPDVAIQRLMGTT